MNYYKKLLKWLCDIQNILAVISLCAMIGLNTVEIFRRYFLGKSWIWIQEVTILFLVCFTFFGFSKVVFDRNDITIALVLSRLKPGSRKVLQLALYVLVFVFCVTYTHYTYRLLLSQRGQLTLVARYPIMLRTIPPLINGASLVLIYFREIYDLITGKEASA